MGDETNPERERAIAEYRNALLEGDKMGVQEYDKAVMTLSGSAIGISFAFLKDICGLSIVCYGILLLIAWGAWGLSITCVLVSHYCSHRAMRRALVDLNDNKLNFDKPGRGWDTAINYLNPIGGILFFVGLLFLLIFISYNFKLDSPAKGQSSSSPGVTTATVTITTFDTSGKGTVYYQTNLQILPKNE